MTSNEITESAKATQELARTSRKGIEATERLGRFASKYINEPLEEVTGMLTDKLRFMRWERQVRLLERANKLIDERKIGNNHRTVPPKIAFPVIENASLEEDDFLQDLWANLLVTSIDPKEKQPRSAYIDIIKQLEPLDVNALRFIYLFYKNSYEGRKNIEQDDYFGKNCEFLGVHWDKIIDSLNIDEIAYKVSIDNLMRLRLITPYFNSVGKGEGYKTVHHGYFIVCITPLGISFVKACMSAGKSEIPSR
ncbi:MAG: DUF4393 domain-containing protein [Candidatus Electrothrix sp. ATG2]|nr:DUF4393 domain-containing protein [Candidatus Electrothrix sp. ATG2]